MSVRQISSLVISPPNELGKRVLTPYDIYLVDPGGSEITLFEPGINKNDQKYWFSRSDGAMTADSFGLVREKQPDLPIFVNKRNHIWVYTALILKPV